jgi:hypothetical protein
MRAPIRRHTCFPKAIAERILASCFQVIKSIFQGCSIRTFKQGSNGGALSLAPIKDNDSNNRRLRKSFTLSTRSRSTKSLPFIYFSLFFILVGQEVAFSASLKVRVEQNRIIEQKYR